MLFAQVDDDGDAAENGETEKLSGEPRMRDASTGMSQEGLSVMIKYNQIGSLTSLSRGSRVSWFDTLKRVGVEEMKSKLRIFRVTSSR